MTAKPTVLHPPNETEHSVSRLTQEGKKITYALRVIQQPERARACGAGAKSSADRRPVDPPPVVELRIFESDPDGQHKTDKTFAYNANFFLFTTLEWARPMAHGRIQGQPTCPVLTGVPVAGIAYLDRPTQAGYFIFPDLSVRHEGLYRLSFNLYEEMKDVKDADRSAQPAPAAANHLMSSTSNKPRAPDQFLHFRLEVKSQPFTVFSAKKFPGLSESTSLSRIVAEQGCRVRIRRDVRMRRREPKPIKDYGGYEDRHATPDAYPATPIERPRSGSNVSMDGSYVYCPTPQLVPQPATPELSPRPQAYQPSPRLPPPPPPPSSTVLAPIGATQSHLTFGTTHMQYSTPQPISQPSVPSESYSSPHPGPTLSRQPSFSSEFSLEHTKLRQPSQSPLPSVLRESSKLGPVLAPEMTDARQSVDDLALKNKFAERERAPFANSLPGLRSLDIDLLLANTEPPRVKATPEPADSTMTEHKRAVPLSSLIQPGFEADTIIPAGHPLVARYDPTKGKGWSFESGPVLSAKRSRSDVFGSARDSQPLHDGKRLDAAEEEAPGADLQAAHDHDAFVYRRAGGQRVIRLINGPDQ